MAATALAPTPPHGPPRLHPFCPTAAIGDFVSSLSSDDLAAVTAGCFDRQLHFWDEQRPELVAQYLLVVDALNFCFWPDGELEYEHLAGGIKRALLADPTVLDAVRLTAIDGLGVRRLLRWPRPLPLEEERARLLREVSWWVGGYRLVVVVLLLCMSTGQDAGQSSAAAAATYFHPSALSPPSLHCLPRPAQVGVALLELYGGQAANLVRAAGQSAVQLVQLVTSALPGFRDHCVYRFGGV